MGRSGFCKTRPVAIPMNPKKKRVKRQKQKPRHTRSCQPWENTKKASVEAQFMQIQEELEKEKAMLKKIAEIHKAAEEKRILVEAKKREDILRVEEVASKFRATSTNPITMKIFKCFGF